MNKSTINQSFSKQFLKNNLCLLTYTIPKSNSVSLGISLLGGSREEKPEELGITHLLEHLLFKQTNKLSGFQIAAKIDSLGGEVNAITDTDEIILYGETVSSELETIFQLFSELLLEANFSEQDLELEKRIVEQEITDSFDDPEQSAFNSLSEIFYPNSTFGKPVFGTKESLASLSLEQLKNRLKTLLSGKRIVISVSGDVCSDKMYKLVEKNFSSLEEGVEVDFSAPKASSGFSVVKSSFEQAYLALGINSSSPDKADYPEALILSHILGGGMASRLFQEVREKMAAAYDVGAELETASKASMLLISASMQKSKIEEVCAVISAELRALAQAKISEEEFLRSKRAISRAYLIDEGLASSTMWRMLSTERSRGEYLSLESFSKQIEKISFDEFKKYMLSALSNKALSAVLLGDLDNKALSYLNAFQAKIVH